MCHFHNGSMKQLGASYLPQVTLGMAERVELAL